MARIGIIGGGFTGLGAAYFLKDLKGHEITVLESGDRVGGLASGFKTPQWEWPIDKAIHHWFLTDHWALRVIKEVGMKNRLIIKDTKSACFYKGKIVELDSPVSVLKFPFLNIFDRIRLGIATAFLKFTKNWKKLEKETAFSYLKRTMGESVFRVIWEPLFRGKFDQYAEQVNAAWFWARIHSRTKKLAYVEGGFQTFADRIANVIRKDGGKVILNAKIQKIRRIGSEFEVIFGNEKERFDYLLLTTPLPIALELFDGFPKEYVQKHKQLKLIGAQYFVLELKQPFLKDIYWLNINEKDFPFMMVAQHTNFVDKKHYDNSHMIWVGKYLDYENPLWHLSESELLEKIIPYLKRINPAFNKSWIVRSFLTRFKNAQPIMPVNYSQFIPKIKTPVPNLYLANMNHVYPWDRGTNYALGLGNTAAAIIKKDLLTSSSRQTNL